MEFKNLDGLNKYLQAHINDVLRDEVAESVKDTMLDAINKTVYGRYTPLYYERRWDRGGLGDRDNIRIMDVDNGIVAMNTTPVNDGYGAPNAGQLLAPIVVSGQGYTYSGYGKAYERERDFIGETVKMLKQDKGIERALIGGLRKRGIDCD